MRLSKLHPSDQQLVQKCLKSTDDFVRSVAETVERTDTISYKQRDVLMNDGRFRMPSWQQADCDYDRLEEDNDFADAWGGSPWGDD